MPVRVFISVLLLSAVGSMLAIFWLLLKPVTRKLFSPRWQYYIWLTVLIVMVLPVRLSLPNKTLDNQAIVTEQVQNIPTNIETQIQTNSQTIQEAPQQVQNFFLPKTYLHQSLFYCLSLIWLLGAVFILIMKIVKYNLFLRTMRKNSELNTTLSDIPKRLKVRKTAMLDAPLIVGLFKPILFLPDAELSDSDMNLVLMHELTHYKRGDLLYKWFMMAVQSVHWFNPIIYVVSRQIDVECEISCDFVVTSKLTETEQNNYMNMILDLLINSRSNLRPLTTQMASSKKILQRRFTMIKKKIKINKKIAVISGILAAVILTTTVFASGILNSTLFKHVNSSIIELNTDEAKDNDFNLLFIGLDNNSRPDTIMLMAIRDNSIKVLSVPRNTILGDKRASDIFMAANGDQEILDNIRQTLSVPIHYYVKMNLTAVKEIIDNVGEIKFDVPMDMSYDDPFQDLHINLKKGVQTLNGEAACQLLQFRRGYTEGDISRIKVHQQFLKELINQKLNKENIDKLPDILKIISDNTETNYPINSPEKAMRILTAIKEADIAFDTIPGKLVLRDQMPIYEVEWNDTEKNIFDSFTNGL